MVCLSRPYHFKLFKGCLLQILLDSFLNTLAHISFNELYASFALTLYFYLENNLEYATNLAKMKPCGIQSSLFQKRPCHLHFFNFQS